MSENVNRAQLKILEEMNRRYKACTCDSAGKTCSGWMLMHVVSIERPEFPTPVMYWICDREHDHTAPVTDAEATEYRRRDPLSDAIIDKYTRPTYGGWHAAGE